MTPEIATVIGLLWCCGAPIMTFIVGIWYARYGLPVSIKWRGMKRRDDLDD
jgi:hypothetical protein